MPDYTIANQVKIPDSFATLGNMVGTARNMTALQQERATLESDISQRKAQSLTSQEVAKQAETKTALDRFKLTGEYAQKARDIGQSLVSDPDVVSGNVDAIIPKIARARQMMIESGVPADVAEVNASHLMSQAASNPKGFRQLLLNSMQAGLGSSGQAGAVVPQGPVVTNQAQTGQMNVNPLAGPTGITPGTMFNNQIPLEQRQQVSTNPVTQSPQVTSKDAFGNVQGVSPAPTTGNVPQLSPGQPEDIPKVTQLRSDVNKAASQVPIQRFNNKQIIELAPKSLAGTGGEGWSKLFSANGLQWVPGDQTANFQRLAHFMAMQAQSNASAMGAGTDQARSLAEQATGSTHWTPAAIISTAKVNDAIATGLENFNKGMEAAIKNNGGNVLAVRDFQNKWTQSFDPDVYRYGNALASKDTAEIDKILGKPGTPERAAKAKALAEKSQQLNRLMTSGQ